VRHVLEDFFAIPAVVATCDYVDPIRQQVVGDFGGDAEAGSGIFAIGDDEVDLAVRDEVREPIADDLATGRADDVTNEEYAHSWMKRVQLLLAALAAVHLILMAK
jgi:hypothetical protein